MKTRDAVRRRAPARSAALSGNNAPRKISSGPGGCSAVTARTERDGGLVPVVTKPRTRAARGGTPRARMRWRGNRPPCAAVWDMRPLPSFSPLRRCDNINSRHIRTFLADLPPCRFRRELVRPSRLPPAWQRRLLPSHCPPTSGAFNPAAGFVTESSWPGELCGGGS